MLSCTAFAAVGRVNKGLLVRRLLLSVANYSESKDVVKQGAEEEALTEYQNKGIISIPPLQTPEVPLITDIPLEEKERIYPQIGMFE